MVKSCVVIQGQVYPQIVNQLIETYKDFPDKILSTWTTEHKESVDILRSKGFQIVIQEQPEYKTPVNYMTKSLQKGIEFAETLGYTHVFRMRTDVRCSAFSKLVNILETDYLLDKLSFIMLCKNIPGGDSYLCDHIVYGPLFEIKKYFSSVQSVGDTRYSESLYQEEYFGISTSKISYDYLKDKVQFFINRCKMEDIQFHYTKPMYVDQGDLVKSYLCWNKEPSLMLQGSLNNIG
jgi:hypothetical protein